MGGFRVTMKLGSHFPDQITKATSPSVVRFGQLSSADKPHVSLKSSGPGEGLQSMSERSYGWCGWFLLFTDMVSKEAGQPSSQRQMPRGNENA